MNTAQLSQYHPYDFGRGVDISLLILIIIALSLAFMGMNTNIIDMSIVVGVGCIGIIGKSLYKFFFTNSYT